MARPKTPFEDSWAWTIYDTVIRFAAVHGWQVPPPGDVWRLMCRKGHKLPKNTFVYHWRRLLDEGRLLAADGVHWLPPSVTLAAQPRPAVATYQRPRLVDAPPPVSLPLLLPAHVPRRPGRELLQ